MRGLIKILEQAETTVRDPKFAKSDHEPPGSKQRERELRWTEGPASSCFLPELALDSALKGLPILALPPWPPGLPACRGSNTRCYESKHFSISRPLGFQSTTFDALKILLCISQQPLCKWAEEGCVCQPGFLCALLPKASLEGRLATEASDGFSPFAGGFLNF